MIQSARLRKLFTADLFPGPVVAENNADARLFVQQIGTYLRPCQSGNG
jgi:hypothetical protein